MGYYYVRFMGSFALLLTVTKMKQEMAPFDRSFLDFLLSCEAMFKISSKSIENVGRNQEKAPSAPYLSQLVCCTFSCVMFHIVSLISFS